MQQIECNNQNDYCIIMKKLAFFMKSVSEVNKLKISFCLEKNYIYLSSCFCSMIQVYDSHCIIELQTLQEYIHKSYTYS